MPGSRHLIFVYPLSQTTLELKKVIVEIKEEEDIEIFEVDEIDEIVQLIPTIGQSLLLFSNPKKCAKALKAAQKYVAHTKSKTILLSEREFPKNTLQKLEKIGVNEVLFEPIVPKALLYKVKFILKSFNIDSEDNDDSQNPKTLHNEEYNEEEFAISRKKNSNYSEESASDYQIKNLGEITLNLDDGDKKRKGIQEKYSSMEGKSHYKEEHQSGPMSSNSSYKEGNSSDLNGKDKKEKSELNLDFTDQEKKSKSKEKEIDNSFDKSDDDLELIFEEDESEKFLKLQEKKKLNKSKDSSLNLEDDEDEKNKDKKQQQSQKEKRKSSSLDLDEIEEDLKKLKKEEDSKSKDKKNGNLNLEEQEKKKKREKSEEKNKDLERNKKNSKDETSKKNKLKSENDKINGNLSGNTKSNDKLNNGSLKGRTSQNDNIKNENLSHQNDQESPSGINDYHESNNSEDENDDFLDELSLASGNLEDFQDKKEDDFSGEDYTEKRQKDQGPEFDFRDSEKKSSPELEFKDPVQDIFDKDYDSSNERDFKDLDGEFENLEDEDFNSLELEEEKKHENDLNKDSLEKNKKKRKGNLEEDNVIKYDWGVLHKRKDNENDKNQENLETNDNSKIKAEANELTLNYKMLREEFDSPLIKNSNSSEEYNVSPEEDLVSNKSDNDYEVYEISLNGLDFLIEYLNDYQEEDFEEISLFKSVSSQINKIEDGIVSFYLYNQKKNKLEKYFSAHEEDSSWMGLEEWKSLEKSELKKWQEISIPTWSDDTFQSKEINFIYPYFEGEKLLGLARLDWLYGLEEKKIWQVEICLESLRGLYLQKFSSEKNYKRSPENQKYDEKTSGFFGRLIKKVMG